MVAALALYWSCPAERSDIRQRVLVFVSMIAVALFSPGGFLACVYLALVPLAAQKIYSYAKSPALFWLFVACVLAPMVAMRLFGDFGMVVTFGTAFATVKSLGMVFTAYDGRERIPARSAFLLIFFFPLFTIGPVERLATFTPSRMSVAFDSAFFWNGLARIIIGLFVVMFICNDLLAPMRDVWIGNSQAQIEDAPWWQLMALIYLSFAFTYLNFVGFSDVAIGMSALFGMRVVENFDRPLIARNLGEFWKRYHISMGNWINQFLFFPLAVSIKKSWGMYAATIIAFVLFGLWHEFSVQYLIWGIANGLGVAFVNFLRARRIAPVEATPRGVRTLRHGLGIVLTITFISWVQTFANLHDLPTAIAMTKGLIGL